MTTRTTRWKTLGLGAALIGTMVLAGCGSEPDTPNSEVAPTESQPVAQADKAAESGHSMQTLSRPERLAFMSGHVQAGLALYRAGQPQMAAKHLLHPVSETHASERQGLAELGFTPAVFEQVSAALEAGTEASAIEDQLAAAEANLADMAAKAGGSDVELIRFLMDTLLEEYKIAITDGTVSDPGEYQDAFGFAIVARQHAEQLGGELQERTVAAINNLLDLWPEAPIPPEDPASVAAVSSAASRVLLTLPIE